VVGRGIGLVYAEGKGRVGSQAANEEIGHATVLIEDESYLPWPSLAKINRRKGVNRDQHCLLPRCKAACKTWVDCGMIGRVNAGESS
jgi:hypothetical protein